jgi:hypothetical protein
MTTTDPYFHPFIIEKTELDIPAPPRALYSLSDSNRRRRWRRAPNLKVEYYGRILA